MAALLREWRASAIFALATLALGTGALVTATGAAAGPGVSTTVPFTFSGTNPCTGDDFVGTGMGLAIYARDGSRVAHLFGSTPIQRVQIVGSRAFVDGQSPTSVVDLDSGAVVGQLPGFAPDLLVGDSREWSG